MKKIVAFALAIIILCVICLVAYFSFGFNFGMQKPASQAPLKIAINAWPGFAYAFVAEEKGFFKKNGVNVELLFFENYADSINAYQEGKTDGVFCPFTDTVFLNLKNKPTKAVYVADYSDQGDVIVGRSELRANFPYSLRGKKIGVDAINSFSHMFVVTILNGANIKLSEVAIVEVPANDVLAALEDGKIDAGHTWEPTKSEAIAKGYKQLDKAGNYPGLITDVLSFSKEALQNRSSDIQSVVNSLIEAADFTKNNLAEAIPIMAKAENMSGKDIKSGLDGVYLLNKQDNITAFSYSVGFDSLHGSFRAINDFFREIGITDKILKSTDYVDPQFVRQAQ